MKRGSLKRTVRKKGRFLYRAYPNLNPAQKMYTCLHTMYPNECTFLVLGSNSDTVLLREFGNQLGKWNGSINANGAMELCELHLMNVM